MFNLLPARGSVINNQIMSICDCFTVSVYKQAKGDSHTETFPGSDKLVKKIPSTKAVSKRQHEEIKKTILTQICLGGLIKILDMRVFVLSIIYQCYCISVARKAIFYRFKSTFLVC